MTSKRYIGIDPGSKGCVAIIDEDDYVQFHDLDSDVSTYTYLSWVLYKDSITHATYTAVENVCGRPGQSCQANTTFMKLAGYAELLGNIICSSGYVKVPPQTWKKHFGLIFDKSVSKTERKHASVELARKLYPAVADQLLLSKDGRAEALLIARYLKDVQHSSELQ